ncbi:hypothetical protein I7648_04285 [Collinsella tanakaei]|nr:hypothetical protein [Collinsella tanakaei]
MDVIQLHIKTSDIDLDAFRSSVDAFASMIRALSDDAAPMATWRVSVDKGSLVLNAQMVIDDDDIDPQPMFQVIQGNLDALSAGTGIDSCPKKAREEYNKLAAALAGGGDNGAQAEILTFSGSDSPSRVLSVVALDQRVAEGEKYKAVGSVTGTICFLSVKRGNKFGMVDDATGRYIHGTFREAVLPQIREALKCRAMVSGVITYHPNGTIASLDARSVLLEPTRLPKLTDMFGILEG